VYRVTFAVVSDLHCRLSNDPTESSLEVGATRIPAIYHPVQALLELIEEKQMRADALLIPGDLANRASREGLSQGWDFALEIGRALRTGIVVPALGNHDVDSRRTRPDQDAFYNVRNLRPGFPFPDSESTTRYFAEGFCIQKVSSSTEVVALNTVIDHTDEQSAKRGRFDISRITRLAEFLRRQGTVLYPAMDKAGIERKVARSYGFHLFRHSAGSQMQEVTGDLKQTQGFLGHASIGITSDVYVHLQPDSEVESMKKLEETFFSELCSTVLETRVEGQKEMVN